MLVFATDRPPLFYVSDNIMEKILTEKDIFIQEQDPLCSTKNICYITPVQNHQTPLTKLILPATLMFCKVKLLFLSKESGDLNRVK